MFELKPPKMETSLTDSEDETQPQLIAQDDDLWVFNKPSGWLSIPGRSKLPVLSDWVSQHYSKPFVVHRLDEQTSGVIVFAKHEKSHQQLNEWFLNREIKKIYYALVPGVPPWPVQMVNAPIARKPSKTRFELKADLKFTSTDFSLIQAEPLTGRRHQIRIHLAQLGYPILGDEHYGGKKSSRIFLHSALIQFPNQKRYEAELPEEFLDVLS